MTAFPHPTSTFSYTCRSCGRKFTSDKNPQKITLFGSSAKIEGHTIEPQELNLKCPNCGSRDLNLDWGKSYGSGDEEKPKNISDSKIPVTARQKIWVLGIEKIVGVLSFFAGKITKADKVKTK